MIRVTDHACLRYQERVAPVTIDEARAILSTAIIEAAISFGARYVRLGTGQRVVIDGCAVVTVLPAEHYKRQVGRKGLPRYRH